MTTPALLTIAEAAATLRCGRNKVFELIAKGVLIKGPKYGKHTVVYADSVFAALDKEFDPPAPEKPKRIRSPRGVFAAACDEWVARARR